MIIFLFVENEDFSEVMNSFFDLDQSASIGMPCAHYVFNLISFRRRFEFRIGATKLPGSTQMMIFETNRTNLNWLQLIMQDSSHQMILISGLETTNG